MYRTKKINFFNKYKMRDIGVKEFADAKVHTIIIGNRRLFWGRMRDVQDGLRIKNVSDLVR